jgi:signal transduction histidine kinase
MQDLHAAEGPAGERLVVKSRRAPGATRVPGAGSMTVTGQTLSRRLTIANAMLIVAIVALGAAAIGGLLALRAGVALAADEYEEVRVLDRVRAAVDRAILLAHEGAEAIRPDVESAREGLRTFFTYQGSEVGIDPKHQARERGPAADAYDAIEDALRAAEDPATADRPTERRAAIAAALDRAIPHLTALESVTDVAAVRRDARRLTSLAIGSVAALAIVIVAAAVFLSIVTHRRIVGGLRHLQEGTRTVASGRFAERVPETGDREIVELARDFNQMAAELDTLYRVMEARIEEKSRELVRSERLASVGFLAAGVAHEITNPLGIMTGYAELARGWLAGRPTEAQLRESREALDTIRDEAFRCKRIVEQLLELSRSGDGSHVPVALDDVARDVVTLVRGLDRTSHRRLVFERAGADGAVVRGSPGELKQVVLNLVVNAIDATDPERGEVRLRVESSPGAVRLVVADNGCGIPADAVEKVFEPFYTRRTGTRGPGLGLGLTISHAIIEAHGGHLSAASEGPGRGSRFTMELPADEAGSTSHEDQAD